MRVAAAGELGVWKESGRVASGGRRLGMIAAVQQRQIPARSRFVSVRQSSPAFASTRQREYHRGEYHRGGREGLIFAHGEYHKAVSTTN